ncbi:MAG: nuclear transport factor 2 family protein [Oleiharenicola lentus]
MRTPVVFLISCILVVAGWAKDTSVEIDLVRRQVEAFNRHSPDDVVACYAENIKWRNIDGDTVTTEGEGRENIRTWLTGYFNSLPTVKSELFDINQTGPYVVFRERASWTGKDGGPRSQVAIGVFEVRDSLIQRAWYFPAVREQAAAK